MGIFSFPRRRRSSEGDQPIEIGGRYVVETELARGGMGRVLRVRHRELGKPLALKLLGVEEEADARARAAFWREARAAASLDHPHVVQVYDFGEDPVHGLYLVMELLDGESTAQRLRRERWLSPIAACDIAAQTAEALDYVHARGLVHGDVKPENIFLSLSRPPDGAPRAEGQFRRNWVRLLDFGLARPWRRSGETSETRRHVEGTPAYIAPELVTGGDPTPASDLYALGVSLFEMITGRPPFVGSLGEVMTDHLRETVPTLSDVRGVAVPAKIETLAALLLAKDPAGRPPDAHAVFVALRGCVAALGGRRRLSPRTIPGRSRLSEAVIDDIPLGIFLASPTGVLLFTNPALHKMLGGPSDELRLGSSRLAEVFPRIERDVRAVLARARPIRRRGVTEDGPSLQLTLSPHRRDGEVIGVCGVVDVID